MYFYLVILRPELSHRVIYVLYSQGYAIMRLHVDFYTNLNKSIWKKRVFISMGITLQAEALKTSKRCNFLAAWKLLLDRSQQCHHLDNSDIFLLLDGSSSCPPYITDFMSLLLLFCGCVWFFCGFVLVFLTKSYLIRSYFKKGRLGVCCFCLSYNRQN